MAYVNQEDKKNLAPEIKKVLKKYGMKGSIGIRNHMVLVVTLTSGELDVLGNWAEQHGSEKPSTLDISSHWIHQNFTGKVRDFLVEMFDAMKGPDWYNNSDIQTDYFDIKHYTEIHCGKWNKPYILTQKA